MLWSPETVWLASGVGIDVPPGSGLPAVARVTELNRHIARAGEDVLIAGHCLLNQLRPAGLRSDFLQQSLRGLKDFCVLCGLRSGEYLPQRFLAPSRVRILFQFLHGGD